MNEMFIATILRNLYDACLYIEYAKDDILDTEENEELLMYLEELYDNIFDLTTQIEEYFGLLD